ncbi:DNA sulfur modification protein DndE [Mycolicibacterium mageritense]|uniref:DNA sulfur modification protein DndE n=1 Tax=Mycolicibacterium mageritense TaxID=53462 RepID=UPI00257474EF|nr:DNA sulfur modification protein DndE [Mycolicibacterium mageritense]
MPVDHIRVSQTARDQLITLKRRTGITHWNVLCRWALCRSLAEPAPPPVVKLTLDSTVEMDWRTFGGDHGEVLWALLRLRCYEDGLELDEETLALQFRLHLHRGISYLVGDPRVTDVAGLASVGLGGPPAA